MWFSVWTDLATGGGGGGGAALAALLAALSSAFRNVLIREKRANIDFFINPPFARGGAETDGLYQDRNSQAAGIGATSGTLLTNIHAFSSALQRFRLRSEISRRTWLGTERIWFSISSSFCSAPVISPVASMIAAAARSG